MSNTLDEILERVYLYGMNGGLGYGKFENELSPKEAKQQIQALIAEARIEGANNLWDYISAAPKDSWYGTASEYLEKLKENN